MEKKHTPAPWYSVNFGGFIHIHNEPFYEATDLLDEDKCPAAIHNGQLAETAPELLKALLLILHREFKPTNKEVNLIVAIMRKAIDGTPVNEPNYQDFLNKEF